MLHDVFSKFIFIRGFRLRKKLHWGLFCLLDDNREEKLKSGLAKDLLPRASARTLLQLPHIPSKPPRTDFQEQSGICQLPLQDSTASSH